MQFYTVYLLLFFYHLAKSRREDGDADMECRQSTGFSLYLPLCHCAMCCVVYTNLFEIVSSLFIVYFKKNCMNNFCYYIRCFYAVFVSLCVCVCVDYMLLIEMKIKCTLKIPVEQNCIEKVFIHLSVQKKKLRKFYSICILCA